MKISQLRTSGKHAKKVGFIQICGVLKGSEEPFKSMGQKMSRCQVGMIFNLMKKSLRKSVKKKYENNLFDISVQ